jgi:uncharacterized protein
MRWRQSRKSSNVQDRRGMGMPLVAGGGIGTLVIALLVIFLGGDPSEVMQTSRPAGPPSAEEEELALMISHVLGDTEDVWNEQLPAQAGTPYREPTLVLFSGATESSCGVGQAAHGPFYCPLDESVYIDLSFFEDLSSRFGASGDFAQAYVLAHEVGHHVQTILGTSEQVRNAQQRVGGTEANQLSVAQELQADCYAGIWAYHAQQSRQILEAGDIEEALGAASAIGDDRIQKQTQGHITPDSFTHGSSAQRVEWFRRGLSSGRMESCDTFR